jgi:hypothetical protein
MKDNRKWHASIRHLRVGQHVHLDAVIAHAPLAGSEYWLPILESLVTGLEPAVGRWVVKFPLGSVSEVPASIESIGATIEMFATAEQTIEQPSVARLSKSVTGSVWEGENHRWQWRQGCRSQAVVSVSRSIVEAAGGDPFACELLWEIG